MDCADLLQAQSDQNGNKISTPCVSPTNLSTSSRVLFAAEVLQSEICELFSDLELPFICWALKITVICVLKFHIKQSTCVIWHTWECITCLLSHATNFKVALHIDGTMNYD